MPTKDDENEDRVARLFDMDTREVSLVDHPANKRRFLVVKKAPEGSEDAEKGETKEENGKGFPASAYAYVPDASSPSTWKLRLYDAPGDASPSVKLTALAAAALGPGGFRGQKVQIPVADLGATKSKVRTAWLAARRAADQEVSESDVPAQLRKRAVEKLEHSVLVVRALKGAVDASIPTESAELPARLAADALSLRSVLKGVASGCAADLRRELPDYPEVPFVLSAALKRDAAALLDAATIEVDAVAKAASLSGSVDEPARKRLDAAADRLADVLVLGGKPVVAKSSVPEARRGEVLKQVDSAILSLSELRAALDAPVSKAELVADQSAVAAALRGGADLVSKAIAELAPQAPQEAPVEIKAPVSKVGRPMQSDRLQRLKGAAKLLREALSDLKGGSVSLEKADAVEIAKALEDPVTLAKFNKVASLLSMLVSELDVVKQVGAADVRGATPLSPNAGGGVQPDASAIADASYVFGDGVPSDVALLMKRFDALEQNNAKLAGAISSRDATIKGLKGDLAELKKFREAPSTTPLDGDEGVGAEAAPEFDGWPSDMTAELMSER